MSRQLQLRRFDDGKDPGKTNKHAKPGEYAVAAKTERVDLPEQAQLVSSLLDDSKWQNNAGGDHVVAVDIDLPCHLIETSPGKHHLIVEKAMPWKRYRALLIALEQAGLIEAGYLEASLVRRASYLRIHPTTPLQVGAETDTKTESEDVF